MNIDKTFIQGVAIGAMRYQQCNIIAINWWDNNDGLCLQLNYQNSHKLADLNELEAMLDSFVKVEDVIVGSSIRVFFSRDENGQFIRKAQTR
jgi:hypothetical protein